MTKPPADNRQRRNGLCRVNEGPSAEKSRLVRFSDRHRLLTNDGVDGESPNRYSPTR